MLANIRFKDRARNEHVATVEQFLDYCLTDPLAPFPYPIAASMLEDPQRPDEGLSATQLLSGCVRCKVLQACEDYTEDIEELWHRWRGTMLHGVLEKHSPPGTISEVRFYADMPYGLGLVHGQPDLIWPQHNTLVDLKTTKRIPLWGPWPNHAEQLNIYRWLIAHASRWDGELEMDPRSIDIQHLVVWYADGDGCKPLECTASKQVATKPGAKNPTKTVREPNIWSDEEVEAFLIGRYEDLSNALDLYRNSKKLPPYPPQMDWIGGWEHRFSPTARLCVERFIDEQRAA